jgi:hypothetical protein
VKNIAILFLPALLLISCSETNPQVRRNKDGMIESEVYKNGNTDSTINYYWYGNKSLRQKDISVRENGQRKSSAELYYDSATGKKTREIHFNRARNIEWMWKTGYDEERQMMINKMILSSPVDSGRIYILYSEKYPVRISYMASGEKISKMQIYDSLGKIDHVYLENYKPGCDTILKYETPEAKSAFNDTLLKLTREWESKIRKTGIE